MTREQTYNAGDEDQVRERDKRDADLRARDLDDLRQVLSTKHGLRFLDRMIAMCGVYRISHLTGATAADTAFREGERNIGIQLLADLEEADPAALLALARIRQENEHG